jgi:hypothetical protein
MALEDAESDSQEMKMKKWRRKVNNKEEQATAAEMVKALTDYRIKE